MSNTQEQSLNEDVVFSPVYESSPEFLHCERERRALEALLKDGPQAFHSKLKQEKLGEFISPDEVAQISGWAQDYLCPEGEQEEVGREHPASTYCPARTDSPLPSLKLGWPEERHSWRSSGNTLVYTNPPVLGAPPIREVVRRMIREAQTLVAVVTDKLTDSAVIGDLLGAASRGLPVYVVLNKRSVQDGSTSPRLIHQNIRVRVLGGRTFCSQDGKMVVGELKENFLLVDLDAVMVGSYSLTWADAHLHRQLVTVLSGPVVDCFDKEFRTLYAASTPIPESCWANNTLLRTENVFLKSNHIPKPLPFDINSEDEMWPSPTNDPIDWEALGVINKDQFANDPFNLAGELVGLSLSRPPLFERWTAMENEPLVRRVEFQQCVPPAYEEHSRNTARPEGILYKPQSWQKFYETESMNQVVQSNTHKTGTRLLEEPMFSPYHRQKNEENGHAHFNLLKDNDRGAWSRPQVIGPSRSCEKGSQFPKKPLILMMPVPEDGGSSDFSEILKGLKTECNSAENQFDMIKGKGISMSMQDLYFQSTETDQQDKTLPARRTHSSVMKDYLEGHAKPRLTPAQSLMMTRNEELKAGSSRLANVYANPFRPRSASFDFTRDWQRPQLDLDTLLQKHQERNLDGGH